jgi:hypothetical protein
MGRSYRVELNKSEPMRDRNLIADAKFASFNLLESSESGSHGTVMLFLSTISVMDAHYPCVIQGDCFGVCLVRTRRKLCVRWQAIGHKDEEACVTSYPVPRSTRRTRVFIDFRASDASSAYSASRRETGEASFVLRVEITKAMHAVR